ncbi:MAG: hypothetical protein JNM56_38445 [Planctomycetia bacterium]|nr:hypothetical protein [Planctomycetia bacterium]
MTDSVVRQELSANEDGQLVRVNVYRDPWGEYTLGADGAKSYQGRTLTAAGWRECPDARTLLNCLTVPLSPRKSRLLAVACCRRLLPLTPDVRCERAVEVAERYADGLAGEAERLAARQAARSAAVAYAGNRARSGDALWLLAREIRQCLDRQIEARSFIWGCLAVARATGDMAVHALECAWQADLLRHLVGNPFQPYPAPRCWPSLVVDLARQLYAGADVRLILHDALLDAGHAELAEHFRAEEGHPKGCWALDRVLGRC